MTPGHPNNGRDNDHRPAWESSFIRSGIFNLAAGLALAASPASAQKKYDTGASNTEIKQMQMMKSDGERREPFGPIIEDAGPAG